MRLLSKLKNLFFEEEVVEVKADNLDEEQETSKQNDESKSLDKKDQAKDEIEDVISERELFKSETTFKFPIIFEDDDFIEEKRTNKNALDFETTLIREKKQKEAKEEKKKFRVSPIISPVYGILDKNYKKDDITTRDKAEKIPVIKEGKVDFDIVRKKAYGTLSDEIEEVLELDNNKGMFFNLKDKQEQVVDENNLLYEMSNKEEQPIAEDVTMEAAENNYTDFGLEYSAEKKTKDITEPLDDDLFNLVDSMYEEKEE